MGEPPHRLAQVIRAVLGVVLLLAPVSPIAIHAMTSEAETHPVPVVEASQPHATRARRRTRRPEHRTVSALARAIVSLGPIRVSREAPLPPLRV